jgi:diadenosine tetraphosphate (Ap4A) HIT family hydrolase
MPTLITRAEGIERIRRARADAPCLMCAIVERKVGDVYTIHEDEEHLVSLPTYVRRWGQVLVTPKKHVTSYTEADAASWARSNELALRAARMVERVRSPRRIYLASTGSSAGELVNCSVHLHIHVIPLYDTEDRPADVYSWQEGIYVADPHEWEELRAAYLAVF